MSTTVFISHCPHCGDVLAGQSGQHCAGRQFIGTPKPCGWLRHRCGAVVDPRTWHFTPGQTR